MKRSKSRGQRPRIRFERTTWEEGNFGFGRVWDTLMNAADDENVTAKFFLPYVGNLTIRRTNLAYTGGPAWGDAVLGDGQRREYEDCLLLEGNPRTGPWMPAITREAFVRGMTDMLERRGAEAEACERDEDEDSSDE